MPTHMKAVARKYCHQAVSLGISPDVCKLHVAKEIQSLSIHVSIHVIYEKKCFIEESKYLNMS